MKGSAVFKVCKASGNTCSIFLKIIFVSRGARILLIRRDVFLFGLSLAVSSRVRACAQLSRVKRKKRSPWAQECSKRRNFRVSYWSKKNAPKKLLKGKKKKRHK